MKIDGNIHLIDSQLKTQRDQANPKEQPSEVQEVQKTQDRLEFSTSVREYQKLGKTADETTEIRAERVAKVKAQLDAGTYNIKAEKVAEAIITGSLISRRA
jgi:flagellar biosynthesis anti-sigma factor FlgM